MTSKQLIGCLGLAAMVITHFAIGYKIQTKTDAEVLECIATHGWHEEAREFCTKGSWYE